MHHLLMSPIESAGFRLLLQNYFDPDFQPFPVHFFGSDSAEDQLPGVHEPGKDYIVLSWHITDFHTIGVPDDDRRLIMGIVGLSKKIESIVDMQVGFQVQNTLDMAGSGYMRVEKKYIPFERLGDRHIAALSVQ